MWAHHSDPKFGMFSTIRKAHEGFFTGRANSALSRHCHMLSKYVHIRDCVEYLAFGWTIYRFFAESSEKAPELVSLWAKGSETYDTTDYFMPTGSSDNFHYWGYVEMKSWILIRFCWALLTSSVFWHSMDPQPVYLPNGKIENPWALMLLLNDCNLNGDGRESRNQSYSARYLSIHQ